MTIIKWENRIQVIHLTLMSLIYTVYIVSRYQIVSTIRYRDTIYIVYSCNPKQKSSLIGGAEKHRCKAPPHIGGGGVEEVVVVGLHGSSQQHRGQRPERT